MRCKYCGGEINLSVDRCIGCGRQVDETVDLRLLHDLDALVEKYGLDPDSQRYDVVMEMDEPAVLEQRTSAEPAPMDLRDAVVPGIRLETYYELLGDGMQYEVESLQAQSSDDASEDSPADGDDVPAEEAAAAEDSVVAESEGPLSLRQRAEQLLDKVDEFTAPYTERVREWYNTKMPQLNRAQSSSKWERLAVVGIVAAVLVILVSVISSIISSIPENISGEWRIGEENAQSMVTVEFSGGEVIARVYDDSGEPHIYKTGVYDTSRKNGRDLLTIEYDDGGLSHLYYEINGKSGEFINVDTGTSDSYERIS